MEKEERAEFLLRIPGPLMEQIRAIANEESRGVTAQITLLLKRALRDMTSGTSGVTGSLGDPDVRDRSGDTGPMGNPDPISTWVR